MIDYPQNANVSASTAGIRRRRIQEMVDKEYAESTKKIYNLRIKDIVRFINQNTVTCPHKDSRWLLNADRNKLYLEEISGDFLMNVLDHVSTSQKPNSEGQELRLSTPEGYRSAIIWYYQQEEKLWLLPEEFDIQSKKYLKGYTKVEASKRLNGELPCKGQDVLRKDTYINLTKMSIKRTEPDTHLHLVLTWNLMTRSINTKKLRLKHFSWGEDCILVDWGGKAKNNQDGSSGTRHFNDSSKTFTVILSALIHVLLQDWAFGCFVRMGSTRIIHNYLSIQHRIRYSMTLSRTF